MSDVRDQRIFAAEQIEVPDNFPGILKNFIKAIVRAQPENQAEFARAYFEDLYIKRQEAQEVEDQAKIQAAKASKFYLKNTDKISDHYNLLEYIGDKHTSRVRIAEHKLSKVQRAVKILKKKELEQTDHQNLLSEIELLMRLDHPNIMQVYEMFEDQKHIYFVNGLMQGGYIFDHIQNMTEYNESSASSIIRQLLSAVSYLHSQGYVHGDVKPKNIHFKFEEDHIVKLIDFGTARKIPADHHLQAVHGTGFYVAPECIEQDFNEKCDVWSIGVIFHMLLVGIPPFESKKGYELLEAVHSEGLQFEDEAWNNVSDQAKTFLDKLLCPQDERLTALEALNDEYFQWEDIRSNQEKAAHIGSALQNIQSHYQTNALQNMCLGFMSHHFTQLEDQMELERTFQMMDTSGDGSLDPEEFLDAYRLVRGDNFDVEEIKHLFEEADADHDGRLSYKEWMELASNKSKLASIENIEAMFSSIDNDHNNRVSLKELNGMFTGSSLLDQETVKMFIAMFKEIDDTNSGQITGRQFKDLFIRILEV